MDDSGLLARLPGVSAAARLPSFVRDLPLTRAALAYAEEMHSGQVRDSDEAAFILHPLEVAVLLHNTGSPDAVVAAGVLHDVLEDTGATAAELERRFGTDVAATVLAVSEDESIEGYQERKAALRRAVGASGPPAASVFAADKVTKVRELRTRLARSGGSPTEDERRKLDHYGKSLDTLERALPEHPLVRQLRFELEALDVLPPGRD